MLPLNVDADFALRAASVIPSLVMAVFLSVLALVIGAITLRSGASDRSAERMARHVGLALSERMRPLVAERVRRRTVGSWVGAVVGSFVGVGLSALVPKSGLVEGAPSVWLVLGGWVAGMGIGVMLTAVGGRSPLAPDAPRVARLDSVSLVDYVHPLERNGARLVVALSTAVTLVALGLALTGGLTEAGAATVAAPVLLGIAAVASLLVFEIGSRRILSLGRPASSSDELAWDDALRAQSMRDMLLGPVYTGGYTLLILSMSLREVTSDTTSWWIGLASTLLSVVVALGVAAALILLPAKRPQQHFLRRLWPEVAAAGEQLAEARQYPVGGMDAASSGSSR